MQDDFRIDVKDIQGRDLKTQLILKNRGRDVLFNPDSTGRRVVAEENRNNGRGEEERMQWTYFQTLLGRHAFTPLALYRERFLAFERMPHKFSSESIVQDDIRLIRFVNSKGVRFEYSFKDSALNPHKVETILSDGTVWRRLTTDWRDLPSPMEGKVAWSGELVMFAKNGAVSEQQEWIHVLAEKVNADEDVFSWTAMNLPVGKKRIIYNQNESETNVAFWDGTQFSNSPLAVPSTDGKKQLLIWFGLIGIVVATILTVKKIVSKKG